MNRSCYLIVSFLHFTLAIIYHSLLLAFICVYRWWIWLRFVCLAPLFPYSTLLGVILRFTYFMISLYMVMKLFSYDYCLRFFGNFLSSLLIIVFLIPAYKIFLMSQFSYLSYSFCLNYSSLNF